MAEEDSSVLIGREVVRRRFASLTQVRECLAAQAKLANRGRKAPLGNLLVTRGIIGMEDLKEVLASLGLLTLRCPKCSLDVDVTEYDRRNEYACSQCGGELVFTLTAERQPRSLSDSTAAGAGSFSSDSLVGASLGGCTIRRQLAKGGMGTVYEAEQINLGRTVALKVLAQDLAEDEVFVKRFLQEARAAAELDHINIVRINDAGQEGGLFFYTMEFVEGENLSQRLRREKTLGVEEALGIAIQVAEALDHAHSKKIIHRDIKPENIMLTPEGVVKLADLGLAKKTQSESISTSLTQAGSILGTPFYMAPEQARDFRLADGRSDLYSLGVSIYKMLSGRVPFDGNSPIEVMMKALDGRKTPLADLRPDLPNGVEELVDRMMHVDPQRRFRDAGVTCNALKSLLGHLLEVKG